MTDRELEAEVLSVLARRALTSKDLARRCGVSVRRVQHVLRDLKDAKRVTRHTYFFGSLSYTWVYRLKVGEGDRV